MQNKMAKRDLLFVETNRAARRNRCLFSKKLALNVPFPLYATPRRYPKRDISRLSSPPNWLGFAFSRRPIHHHSSHCDTFSPLTLTPKTRLSPPPLSDKIPPCS